MSYKKWIVFIIFILVLSVLGLSVFASDDFDRDTLRGLQGVYVLVESLDPDAERDGLTKDQLQTDVELKIRMAGIKVLTKEEHLKTAGVPFLYINVNTIKNNCGLYAYSIKVEINQPISLLRNPKILSVATTWSKGAVGTVGEKNLRQIRESMKEVVDNFINAYLAVNPKK